MNRAIAALAVLAACSGSPKQVGSEPSWRHGSGAPAMAPTPTVFAPRDPPAARYDDPAEPPVTSPLGDAVLAAVRDAAAAAGRPAPIADARLFRACAELADVVPQQGVVGYGLVEFALQHNGIAEPSPHLLVVWGPIDAPGPIVDQLKPQLASVLAGAGTLRVGVGEAKRLPDGTGAVVFAVQAVNLTMTPVPRALPPGGTAPIAATIDPRFHDPEVLVTHDDGTTEQLALAPQAGGFSTTLACGARHGRQEVEISAADASGSTVLANFPVWCGAEPPATYAIESAKDDGPVAPDVAEKQLFALLNQARREAGLPALAWDDQLAAVARAHSDEMRKTGVVAHVSPTTGSAADRVKAAGIKTAVVLENVARAYGVHEAHDGLMDSPGHRANILSRSATHVGVGVVLGNEVAGRREMFVTQVFIRIPPKIDPASAVAKVAAKLEAARNVAVDPRLSKVAQQLAEALAAGQDQAAAWAVTQRQLGAFANAYGRVGSVIDATADLDSLDAATLFGTYHPIKVGIGIAQGPHPDLGDNAIYIVLLHGEARGRS